MTLTISATKWAEETPAIYPIQLLARCHADHGRIGGNPRQPRSQPVNAAVAQRFRIAIQAMVFHIRLRKGDLLQSSET